MLHSIVLGPELGPEGAPPAVVLCHGFGADAADLSSLPRRPWALSAGMGGSVRWVLPQAPVSFMTGWGQGRAWFPRTQEGIEAFMTGEQLGSLADLDPAGLHLATLEVIDLVLQGGLDPGRTVIGGFSQGAMVAASAALHMDPLPAGLLLFSGSIIASARLGRVAASRSADLEGFPVCAFHGTEDPVLPIGSGRALAELFREAGSEVGFTEFAGGHGIPPSVLPLAAGFVSDCLSLH